MAADDEATPPAEEAAPAPAEKPEEASAAAPAAPTAEKIPEEADAPAPEPTAAVEEPAVEEADKEEPAVEEEPNAAEEEEPNAAEVEAAKKEEPAAKEEERAPVDDPLQAEPVEKEAAKKKPEEKPVEKEEAEKKKPEEKPAEKEEAEKKPVVETEEAEKKKPEEKPVENEEASKEAGSKEVKSKEASSDVPLNDDEKKPPEKKKKPQRKPIFSKLGWQLKSEELTKIQTFENVRRRSFGRAMGEGLSKWATLSEMLDKTLGDVVASRRLAAKKLQVEEAYARLLSSFRALPVDVANDFPAFAADDDADDDDNNAEDDAEEKKTTSTRDSEDAEETKEKPRKFPAGSVRALCQAQVVAASEQLQAAKAIKEGCLGALSQMEARAYAASRDLKQDGEKALSVARFAAKGVEKLFDSYVAASAQIHAEEARNQVNLAAAENVQGQQKEAPPRISLDMWLADAQYRVAAAALQAAWHASSKRLGELFKVARAVEVDRRIVISKAHDVLLEATALPRGGPQHWPAFPTVRKDLDAYDCGGLEATIKVVDADVAAKVAAKLERRAKLQAKEDEEKAKADAAKTTTPTAAVEKKSAEATTDGAAAAAAAAKKKETTVLEEDGDEVKTTTKTLPQKKDEKPPAEEKKEEPSKKKEEPSKPAPKEAAPSRTSMVVKADNLTLESPLSSPLVVLSALAERRRDGPAHVLNPAKRWRRCVAIITADRFLHVFDCEQGGIDDAFADVASKAADDFLQALVSVPRFGQAAKNLTVVAEPLKPTLSVDLAASVDADAPNDDDASSKNDPEKASWRFSGGKKDAGPPLFHLAETVANVGARKLLGRSQTRHLVLRAAAEDDRFVPLLKRLLHHAQADP